jgi:hypothetical protein
MANPVQFQDCNLITKTYERGCHSSMTEASVYAPITPRLDFIRAMSSTISKQMDAQQSTSSSPTLGDVSANPGVAGIVNDVQSLHIDSPEKEDDFFTKIGKNFVPGGDSIGGILDSECIPCDLRIKFKEELNWKSLVGAFAPIGEATQSMFENWLFAALGQIKYIIQMFKNFDKYMDVCSFQKFLKDFVCIPDLARIMALLTALLFDLAGELNGAADVALALIAPLFAPFLMILLNTLQKYILMIVKPIQCIIDSIQGLLRKFDYNVLFQNVDKFNVSLGPKQGPPPNPEQLKYLPKVPLVGILIPDDPVNNPNSVKNDFRPRSTKFSLSPVSTLQATEEQVRINRAAESLERLRKASRGIDASDKEAYEKHRSDERAANQEYNDAVKERNLSEIGELNQGIDQFQVELQSLTLRLITLLREGVLKINSYFNSIFDEIKKLMGEYVGGTGNYLSFSHKKLVILQMLALIKSIIEFLRRGARCEDENQEIEVVMANVASDFRVWRDDTGAVHIEETVPRDLADALDNLARAFGSTGGSFGGSGASDSDIDKSKGLFRRTGDDILDTELSKTMESLINPAKVKINCQMLALVDNAEKVNQWVRELENE